MTFKKILVPIDFSECSKNALKNAIPLAKKTGAKLLLLHAFQIPVAHGELGAQGMIMGLASDIEKNIEEDFVNLRKEFPELNDINNKNYVKHAYPVDAISSTVLTEKVDLIIMGTHGASGIEEVIMGTNAYSVIKNLSCPVLVIPEKGSIQDIKRIALASDYKHLNDISILNPMADLAKLHAAEIDIFHLSDRTEISEEEVEEAKLIEKYLKKIEHSYHFQISKDVEQAINEHLEERQIDMLTMIPRHHKFFERLFEKQWTKKMAFHSKTPLLALPDK
jgi:nucleotide-binding universal stress UspA family protein